MHFDSVVVIGCCSGSSFNIHSLERNYIVCIAWFSIIREPLLLAAVFFHFCHSFSSISSISFAIYLLWFLFLSIFHCFGSCSLASWNAFTSIRNKLSVLSSINHSHFRNSTYTHTQNTYWQILRLKLAFLQICQYTNTHIKWTGTESPTHTLTRIINNIRCKSALRHWLEFGSFVSSSQYVVENNSLFFLFNMGSNAHMQFNCIQSPNTFFSLIFFFYFFFSSLFFSYLLFWKKNKKKMYKKGRE